MGCVSIKGTDCPTGNPPADETGGQSEPTNTSEMVIYHSSDIEHRSGFESADKLHKGKGCFGIGVGAIVVQIEMIKSVQRI